MENTHKISSTPLPFTKENYPEGTTIQYTLVGDPDQSPRHGDIVTWNSLSQHYFTHPMVVIRDHQKGPLHLLAHLVNILPDTNPSQIPQNDHGDTHNHSPDTDSPSSYFSPKNYPIGTHVTFTFNQDKYAQPKHGILKQWEQTWSDSFSNYISIATIEDSDNPPSQWKVEEGDITPNPTISSNNQDFLHLLHQLKELASSQGFTLETTLIPNTK